MATWHPADGSHAAMPGAPDAYCYRCQEMCGGTDAAGNTLICKCCQEAERGPEPGAAPEPSVGAEMPQTGTLQVSEAGADTASEPAAQAGPEADPAWPGRPADLEAPPAV